MESLFHLPAAPHLWGETMGGGWLVIRADGHPRPPSLSSLPLPPLPPVSAAPSPGANMGDLDVEEWVLQSCGGDVREKTQGEGEGEETGVKERWAATRGAATSFGASNERPFIVPRSSFKLFLRGLGRGS